MPCPPPDPAAAFLDTPRQGQSPFLALSPHDLAHIRLAGVFVLVRSPRTGPVQLLAAGQGDPLNLAVTAAQWSHAHAQGCNEARVHLCPDPRCRQALAAALAPNPFRQARALPPLHGEGQTAQPSGVGKSRGAHPSPTPQRLSA